MNTYGIEQKAILKGKVIAVSPYNKKNEQVTDKCPNNEIQGPIKAREQQLELGRNK